MSGVHPHFAMVAANAVEQIGPTHLKILADRIAEGGPTNTIIYAVPVPGFSEIAHRVLSSQLTGRTSNDVAAAYLRGVAVGYERHRAATSAESVWTGPSTHSMPVRSTAQALVDLVSEASYELILMTHSAKPYEPLREVLTAAIKRGVSVTAVVETPQGAGSGLAGVEPAAAFASLAGVELWHWPVGKRTEQGATMRAKLAVADRRVLLVSSADLTQSAVTKNIEAGLVVRGGTAPRRAAEHIAELRAKGMLERLR